MQRLLFVVLLCGSFLVAQDNTATKNDQAGTTGSNNQITVRGCLDRSRGDYILEQGSPGMTYELQGSPGVKLGQYFGHRVELTGTKFPSLSTSSDSIAFGGSPAPVTIRVTSIKILDQQCSQKEVSR